MNSNSLKFSFQWDAAGNDAPELYATMARLSLDVGGYSLTRNEDTWSRTVKEDVLVSLYPLATWFASSWWRLLNEPHPGNRVRPSISWRMAHEITAANHGFVWPTALFASDGEAMQIWSSASDHKVEQSVKYLNGSSSPAFVPMTDFSKEVAGFIAAVLDRLRDSGHANTELAQLWKLVCDEQASPIQRRQRRFEAMMGYDPEECPEPLLQVMLNLTDKVGEPSLMELMSALAKGKEFQAQQEKEIDLFSSLRGLEGKPDVPTRMTAGIEARPCPPWELAVEDAKDMRNHLGQGWEPIDNKKLFDVLGIRIETADNYILENATKVSVAIPSEHNRIRLLPRKKHPTARRFEYARLLADYIFQQQHGSAWLVSSDLNTFRQKYQRAFAAELLCPIDGVTQLVQGDYSESSIEEAAEYFGVSTTTVASLLTNNGLVQSDNTTTGIGSWPYRPVMVSG